MTQFSTFYHCTYINLKQRKNIFAYPKTAIPLQPILTFNFPNVLHIIKKKIFLIDKDIRYFPNPMAT